MHASLWLALALGTSAGCAAPVPQIVEHIVQAPRPAPHPLKPLTCPAPPACACVAPTADAPPSDSPPPPLEHTIVGRRLRVHFEEGVAPGGRMLVHSIDVDGWPIYPADCKGHPFSGACTKAHVDLREGHGSQLLFVSESEDGDARARMLFAWINSRSPECANYGYWVLFFDRGGFRLSQPLSGCFHTPISDDGGLNVGFVHIEWQRPAMVRAVDIIGQWRGVPGPLD